MAGYINKYPTLSEYTTDASDRKSLGGSTVNLITEGDGEVKYERGLNPLHLPPFTIRCKFSSSETPAPTHSGVTWDSVTLVDSDEHIWDITKNNSDWKNLFRNNDKLVTVLGANTTGVTNMTSLFLYCSELVYIPLFDTSSVTSMKQMFAYCTKTYDGASS